MSEIRLKLKPWNSPNYVIAEMPPRLRQDGWTEPAGIPLAEVDADVLAQMCDAFRADVFRKAGKPDPADAPKESR